MIEMKCNDPENTQDYAADSLFIHEHIIFLFHLVCPPGSHTLQQIPYGPEPNPL